MLNQLVCNNATKIYNNNNSPLKAVDNANVSFSSGNLYVITGKSGSGKSTLLRILGGLEEPTHGEVIFEGEKIYSLNEEKQAAIRGEHFGFVFQSYCLMPELTIYDNIALPRYLRQKHVSKNEIVSLAELLGISKKLYNLPYELSGGQQQRAAIARACINNPDIIFADEPTGNLDEENRWQIYNLLMDLVKTMSKTLIVVTHDDALIEYCNVHYTMRDGVISE